jgi:lysophospholipase L1-like esterase
MLRLVPRRGSLARRRLLAATALALAIVALLVDPRAAHSTAPRAGQTAAAPVDSTTSAPRLVTTTTVFGQGVSLDRTWPKTVTLVTDSVTLGAAGALRADLPGWHVQVLGKPALMIKQAVPLYLPPGRRVGSVVVVGLGYNSLWQRDRLNFATWAGEFDSEADSLVSQLRSRGAKKIVWVTLREPSPQVVTVDGEYQFENYAWFFPYVNERLRALVHRQPDIALADWAKVSDRVGVTYDLIHLNPDGARLMAGVIVGAIKG